jgi:hypothetical protein
MGTTGDGQGKGTPDVHRNHSTDGSVTVQCERGKKVKVQSNTAPCKGGAAGTKAALEGRKKNTVRDRQISPPPTKRRHWRKQKYKEVEDGKKRSSAIPLGDAAGDEKENWSSSIESSPVPMRSGAWSKWAVRIRTVMYLRKFTPSIISIR